MSQPPAAYRLVRADDQLDLRVIVERMTVFDRGTKQPQELVADRVDLFGTPVHGYLSVQFEAQHVVEWATTAGSGLSAGQPRPIYGDRTTVRFAVPPGTVVPLDVEGLLAALRTLPINVFPTSSGGTLVPETARPAAELVVATRSDAARTGDDPLLADRERRTAAELTALDPDPLPAEPALEPVAEIRADPVADSQGPAPAVQASTELMFPSRMTLQPLGHVGFAHSAAAVDRDGRVELWHTRLGGRSSTGTVTEQATSSWVSQTRELPDGFTSAWAQRVGDAKINNALRKADRIDLVDQTFFQSPTVPLTTRRMVLSAHGAWLDVEGDWPGRDLLSYEHTITQGRDTYVRTAAAGFLYPLGHEAYEVEITRRVLPQRDGEPVRLETTKQIVVKTRDKLYGDGDRAGRGWPWRSVRIETRRHEGERFVIATGAQGKQALLPLAPGGAPFEFQCTGTDRGERVSTFSMPLYFVPTGFGALTTVEQAYQGGVSGQPAYGGETFRTLELRGQRVSIAPVLPGAADATDVVTDSVRLVAPSTFTEGAVAAAVPILDRIVGRVPALEQLVPGAGTATQTLEWATAYVEHAFGSGNVGEALLQLLPGTAGAPRVDLSDPARTGALFGASYALTGLSRSLGPVGGDLAQLASGTYTPSTLFAGFLDQVKLLGVFALRDLIGADTEQALSDAPKLVSTTLDGITSPHLSWSTTLFKGFGAGTGIEVGVGPIRATLRRRQEGGQDQESRLSLTADTSIDTGTGTMRHQTVAEITNVELALSLQGEDQLVVPLENITFASRDGEKPDVDVNLGEIRFLGVLAFVRTLAELIPADGFHDPPALDIRQDGVTSSFSLPLPPVATGIFVLENIALHSQLDLFFGGAAPTFELAFARADSPFRLTVIGLGGGGWIAVKVGTDGFRHLCGALEFGAAVAVDFGVARGSVSAMGGLAFFVDGDGFARLTAYFTVRGELRVLGLITISAELTLSLTYESPPPRLYGKAELVVKVKLLFFKKTVRIEFEKTFAGADPGPDDGARAIGGPADAVGPGLPAVPPVWADVMAVGEPGARPWDIYCLQYAED